MNFELDSFRRRFPEMTPYVGDNYLIAQEHKCALLVIGESHYLPNISTIHLNCDAWYVSDHTRLNEEEKNWINTRDIVRLQLPENRPDKLNPSHGILNSGYSRLNKYGPGLADYSKLFSYTIFFNFYLRPAREGASFKDVCTPKDNDIANANFKDIIEHYKPNGVVFLSRLAFESCKEKAKLHIPVAGAPHPTCRWWNKKCAKYGGRFGRDLVADGMMGFDWSWLHD